MRRPQHEHRRAQIECRNHRQERYGANDPAEDHVVRGGRCVCDGIGRSETVDRLARGLVWRLAECNARVDVIDQMGARLPNEAIVDDAARLERAAQRLDVTVDPFGRHPAPPTTAKTARANWRHSLSRCASTRRPFAVS